MMTLPATDDKNPLYCPQITKSFYLKAVNGRRPAVRPAKTGMRSGGSEKSTSSDRILEAYFSSGNNWIHSSPGSGEGDLPPYSSIDLSGSSGRQNKSDARPSGGRRGIKRKSSETFSDFRAPPKYARSIQSVHDSSFDIEFLREELRFLHSSPAATAVVTDANAPFGNSDLENIVHELDLTLPGIRLGERLRALDPLTPQTVVDFLARNDHLNERTLTILQFSNVETIAFSPSPLQQTGLNLCSNDIYSVFRHQNAFQDLSCLSFAGTRLRDSDIIHIHHLPRLSVLLLDETGISNEAIFLLVPLKDTLAKLSLAVNPDINNDAVPALLLLHRLSFLSISDTAIDMDGLRRIAELAHHSRRSIHVELPFVCEFYIMNIHTKYLLEPHPPLITNENVCNRLTPWALKRNLEAHASCNPAILASGTHSEMVHRLTGILKTRTQDRLVIEMIQNQEMEGFYRRN